MDINDVDAENIIDLLCDLEVQTSISVISDGVQNTEYRIIFANLVQQLSIFTDVPLIDSTDVPSFMKGVQDLSQKLGIINSLFKNNIIRIFIHN